MNHDQRLDLQSVRCQHCRYYDLDNGLCRRYPPAMLCINGAVKKAWPPMSKYSWCGEYKRAKWVDELLDDEE